MDRLRLLTLVVYSQFVAQCRADGAASCPCVSTAQSQTAAEGKPAFVTGTEYGYGCKAHDDGNDVCSGSTKTADGQEHDWCKDKWCIVDPSNCDLKARAVTYTAATGDYFSYKTCDADFKGNQWVGTEVCKDNAESYCTAAENTETGDVSNGAVLPAVSVTLLIVQALYALHRA